MTNVTMLQSGSREENKDIGRIPKYRKICANVGAKFHRTYE